MRNSVDIIDNFLDKKDFQSITNKICSPDFHWRFSNYTTSIKNDSNKLNDFLFVNLIQSSLSFYEGVGFTKPFVNEEVYNLLKPLLVNSCINFNPSLELALIPVRFNIS